MSSSDTPVEDVRGLAMWQPWAAFVEHGIKWIETRSWSTNYRGRMKILATKRPPFPLRTGGGGIIGQYVLDWGQHGELGGFNNGGFDECCGFLIIGLDGESIPLFLGCFVAEVDLIDVLPMVAVESSEQRFDCDVLAITPSDQLVLAGDFAPWHWRKVNDQRPYGDFAPGRYAWLFDNVKRIDPIPAKGHQGLWRVDG